jgi:hypothetical protein
MKSALRMLAFLVVSLGMVAGPAFGQGFMPKKIWDLTVTVNAPNAVVYIDNVPAPGGTTKVAGGPHNVRVHADGYFDFNGPVVVNGNTTFPVTLAPMGFPLTVMVNVPNARVLVDGTDVTGTVPTVTPGDHQIQVTAPGYTMYSALVSVQAPATVNVVMQPALALRITVNVPNAVITVDNVPIQGNIAYVSRGPHSVNVHADGYSDWTGTVNVLNNMPFSVRLTPARPAGFPLAIRVNVPNARVFVDNAEVTGSAPPVAPGQHTVRVTAPGFRDYTAAVNVTAPMTLDVVLQAAGVQLSVNANVPNAMVTVNGTPKGPAPYSEFLPRGTYSVRVTADGYADYSASVALNQQPVNLAVTLQPALSTLSFVLPQEYRDQDTRPGDSRGQVKIYVDNRLVNPNRETQNISVPPGPHSIRVASGAFSASVDNFTVQPGQSYVIELYMGLDVRAAQ